MSADATPFRLVIVMPVYEDATSAARLLEELPRQFTGSRIEWRGLLVDDGSHIPLAEALKAPAAAGRTLEILRLRRNVGHQRAIALGLAYVHDKIPCDAVLVMDADGEDRPEDALRLVERFREGGGHSIVFAARARRSESWLFLTLYRLYQVLHWVLTGVPVRVGNFSVVPASCLSALVTLPTLWNHYAAAVFHSGLGYETHPTRRGLRYSGKSKMNYLSLIMHGLHAISVFSDVVAVRLLLAAFGLSCVCGGLFLTAAITGWRSGAIPAGWAGYGWGALSVLLLLTLGCFLLVLQLMSQRNSLDFLPLRDYPYFVERVVRLSPAHE